MIIDVLELPPSDSQSKRVIFESQYGMYGWLETSPLMTLEREPRERLIDEVSEREEVSFSEPARSTRVNLEVEVGWERVII